MAEILTSIESSSWILAYTTADPNTFNVPITAHVSVTVGVNQTAYDLKLKHVCDHQLSSGTYTLNTCPRCLGNGHYYDVKINEDGQLDTTSRVNKLLQELEKITITSQNPFHPNYGVDLLNRVGQIPIQDLKGIIQRDLIAAVKSVQAAQQTTEIVYAPDEIITKLVRIDVHEFGQTSLQFQVIVQTAASNKVSFKGIVDLGL